MQQPTAEPEVPYEEEMPSGQDHMTNDDMMDDQGAVPSNEQPQTGDSTNFE